MPDRGEQVSLADTETTVEIEPGWLLLATTLATEQAAEPTMGTCLRGAVGESRARRHRLGLTRFVGIRDVGAEPCFVEPRRRHERRHQLVRSELGTAIDKPLRAHASTVARGDGVPTGSVRHRDVHHARCTLLAVPPPHRPERPDCRGPRAVCQYRA